VPTSCRSRLVQRFPARPASVAALRRAVDDYAAGGGIDERRREDIALAVSEAVSNAVVHAYADRDDPGEVRLDAWIDAGGLQIAICDHGVGMSPRVDSPGLGLGLPLMGKVTDRLLLEDSDPPPGTCVRMTFALR
jgi:anti-sigma regulatory factor (Ser/Thr protein kinase)